MVAASARANDPSPRALSKQAASAQRYAPRPAAFPRGSTLSAPVPALRTTLTRSRLSRSVRQATHVRRGSGRRRSAPIAPLLPAEQRAVLVLERGLVGQRGLGLGLHDEILPDALLVDGRDWRGLDRLLDRLGLDRRLGLGGDLGLAADVDPPAPDLRREASVLALPAAGQPQEAG